MSTGAGAISIDSPTTVDFGAITPPKATATTTGDINVTVINDGTTGYTLAAQIDTVTYTQAISLKSGGGAVPTDTTFTSPFGTTFTALTSSAVQFASRATGATPEAGDVFSVSLQFPTFAWQRAAASATIGVITFTAVAT